MSVTGAFIVPHPPLIIPEIGHGQQIKIENTVKSYDEIAKNIGEIKPDTIVIITPHSVMYSDYIHISPGEGADGNFREFGYENIKFAVKYDTEFVNKLCEHANKNEIHAGVLGEKNRALDHGTMIPLYFINKYFKDYNVVRIGISGLSFIEHYNFGKLISKTSDELNRKIVIVASGDLSHTLKEEGPYGYTEEGPIFDKEVTSAMAIGDFLKFLNFNEEFCEIAAECGLRSFIIMAGALDGKSVNSHLHSYEGPFGVGYAVSSYIVTGNDDKRHFDIIYGDEEVKRLKKIRSSEDDYVNLARKSLESYVTCGKKIDSPVGLPKEMTNNKAGVFVSLYLDGKLRGCIGTIKPATNSIAHEIIQNAISAGLEDPRFNEVTKSELNKLVYSVDVLGAPEHISSMDELNPKKYGVIVSKGRKRGLLLPNLEGIDEAEEQVDIALKKAGIAEAGYMMERFEVIRHK